MWRCLVLILLGACLPGQYTPRARSPVMMTSPECRSAQEPKHTCNIVCCEWLKHESRKHCWYDNCSESIWPRPVFLES